MKNNHRFVHCSEYLPIYHKLPINKKALAVGLLGYKSCSQFIKSKYITKYYFDKLVEFKEHICKYKESSNFVGNNAPFDLEQLKQYYNALNDWIESDEYVNASMKKRNRIIDEQKRISKIININK